MVRISVDPVAKPRMTRADKFKRRPAVLRYRAYCDFLRYTLRGWNLPNQFRVDFRISMPASWSKKKGKEMNGKPHCQVPDIDNLLKGLMDALLPEGDAAVWSVTATKRWGMFGQVFIEEGHYVDIESIVDPEDSKVVRVDSRRDAVDRQGDRNEVRRKG